MYFPQYAGSPTKWQKYLLLAEHGLATLEELETGIKRYTWKGCQKFIRDLTRRLRKDKADGSVAFYVVKLVPRIQQGQLPNLRIMKPHDFTRIKGFFEEYESQSFGEVWYCRTAIDPTAMSTAGRFVFLEDGGQIVEHVSRCSPRMIELFAPGNFAWPFIQSSRPGWGRHFNADIVHIPPEYDSREVMNEFESTMRNFEESREDIIAFCDFLETFKFSAYSLEYKCVGNSFRIIDWDTADDLRVLR